MTPLTHNTSFPDLAPCSEMPWLALPFEDREAKAALSREFKVQVRPSLVRPSSCWIQCTLKGRSGKHGCSHLCCTAVCYHVMRLLQSSKHRHPGFIRVSPVPQSQGIPTFVILDAATGEVINSKGR